MTFNISYWTNITGPQNKNFILKVVGNENRGGSRW